MTCASTASAGSPASVSPPSPDQTCKQACRRRSARRGGEAWGTVRDLLLNQALKQFAAEAATRLSTLVAGGDQIPFDVAEQDGPDSLFHSYVPLTGRYVFDHEADLRALASFEPARVAVTQADVAASYLESRGEVVAAEPDGRAARMLVVFIAELWDGCTEFALDRTRLDAALTALDAEARDASEADLLIVPLVGLRMAVARLQLPHGVQVVRADAIEAPIEAMRSEGMGRAAWEPQFLALAEQEDETDSAESALHQLRELISVMHLFKAGSVGLGPYAFAPTGDGQWRRIATGAPATRPGGYALSKDEAAELTDFARTLEARPDPDGALAWAVGRFEMGCGRESALQGLSDHLLALRSVLEGHGPVGASLPMRASALIADETYDRIEAREQIEHALELERSLMNGSPSIPGLALAAWIEEGVRRILRDAALGELGTDLNAAADEALIATGLEAGDVEIAVAVHESSEPSMSSRAEVSSQAEDIAGEMEDALDESQADHVDFSQEEEMSQETRILEPVPAEDEIRIVATNWLDEVEVEESTLDFPAIEGDVTHRERIDTPRVRHLFPVPEDADWEVRELRYDHYDRAS